MITDQSFGRIRFSAPDMVDRQWLDWYRDEFSRRMFQCDVEMDAERPFRLNATLRLMPHLSIYTGGASAMRTIATAEARNADVFGLTIALKGEMSLRSRLGCVVLEAGAAIFGRPVEVLQTRTDTETLSVRLSRKMLSPLVPDLADRCFAPLLSTSPPLRLLRRYLNAVDEEDRIDAPEAMHLIALHVHDLVALALGATRDATVTAEGRGARAARLAAIKQDIVMGLADLKLSVASTAKQHNLSPRYIHKLFELDGTTFSEFVVSQRLTRAHRMLQDPRFAGGSISTIALAVGFGDLSYFNRTFRRRYGATPSEVRAARQDPACA